MSAGQVTPLIGNAGEDEIADVLALGKYNLHSQVTRVLHTLSRDRDTLRAEVQRLTEESRRSDAGRVEVPELTADDLHPLIEWVYGTRVNLTLTAPKITEWFRYRLSPSPQPSADVVPIGRVRYFACFGPDGTTHFAVHPDGRAWQGDEIDGTIHWRAKETSTTVDGDPVPPDSADVVVPWISVEDRLPEDGQSVAFVTRCDRDPFYHGRVLGGRYTAGEFGGFSVPGLMSEASHWLPLPPAPDALRPSTNHDSKETP